MQGKQRGGDTSSKQTPQLGIPESTTDSAAAPPEHDRTARGNQPDLAEEHT